MFGRHRHDGSATPDLSAVVAANSSTQRLVVQLVPSLLDYTPAANLHSIQPQMTPSLQALPLEIILLIFELGLLEVGDAMTLRLVGHIHLHEIMFTETICSS